MKNIKTSNILSVFAGREDRMKVLMKYLNKAIEMKIIDEVHLWNYARNESDRNYLFRISNILRTPGVSCNYMEIFTPVINDCFHISCQAANDMHVLVNETYEIVIGGWNNTKSIVRDYRSGLILLEVKTPNILSEEYRTFSFSLFCDSDYDSDSDSDARGYILHPCTFKTPTPWAGVNERGAVDCAPFGKMRNLLQVVRKDTGMAFLTLDVSVSVSAAPFSKTFPDSFSEKIHSIHVKTGYGAVGMFAYETIKNHGIYLMEPCTKTPASAPWKDYYEHYSDPQYRDSIIIKCDDDIVFIDLHKFKDFIAYRKASDEDLIFANIINNGVAGYYQQTRQGLIPDTVMSLEYPPGGFGGTLLMEPGKAEALHRYFVSAYRDFVQWKSSESCDGDDSREGDTAPNCREKTVTVMSRFSINFFAYKGSNWHKIKDCYASDEVILTTDKVWYHGFRNVMYLDFFVSHLSFYTQEKSMNVEEIVEMYDGLYKKLHTLQTSSHNSLQTYKIVISRYNEDISWTKDLSNVVVYNKGLPIVDANVNQKLLQNVGRDGHTIYNHIYENYDALEDYTIFLQGNPFDHSPNVMENLRKFFLLLDGSTNGVTKPVDFVYLSETMYVTSIFDCPHHSGLPMRIVYNAVFGTNAVENRPLVFGSGGQFIVSRRRVHSRPREFYLNMVRMLEYRVNPIEGYVIERLHQTIFCEVEDERGFVR